MKKKIVVAILAVVIVAAAFGAGYWIADSAKENKTVPTEIDRDYLGMYKGLLTLEDTVYVIGHQSPDSDTVLSAIAMANLLNKIGVKAEARVVDGVNDETKAILGYFGVEAPAILEDATGKNLFLVDHNEYSQAVSGAEQANIVGIVDHHSIGSVKSIDIIFSKTAPLGSTAFLVYSLYKELGIPVDPTMAGLLIGAEMSDTNNMKYEGSITHADETYMSELLVLSGVNRDELNLTRLKAKVNYEGKTSRDLLFLDYKNYEIGSKKLGIGTLDAIGKEDSDTRIREMIQAMDDYYAECGVDYLYLMIHDYATDEQYILCKGDGAKELCEQAMKKTFDTYLTLTKSVSRKAVFVPALTRTIEGE